MNKHAIHYRIRPFRPEAHLFEVSCTVPRPDPAGQRFSLPAWIPGSYLIRDFARHIVAIRAEADGQPIHLEKLDKHTWQAEALKTATPLTLTCEIHAWDLSVRGAHLDWTHAFFNGSSVFLSPQGCEEHPCLVDIQPPPGKAGHKWRVATTLPLASGEKGAAQRHAFGLYRAANYAELIDHPVEMGEFTLASFEACGVTHEIAITGRHDCDMERLCADLQRVCEWQIRFFEPGKENAEGKDKAKPPFERYLFLVTALGEGYGGLEHRSSTALICSRHDLPWQGMPGMNEEYRGFLGLCSHEYFHGWNVKRIRPRAFAPPDLSRECHTRLLWAFEGITSYYDDLALLRSGCITLKDWLELTAKAITSVQRTPGRLRQTLAESSFDAWTKFYRPDENTPNAVISYYSKGALAALALDLTLRSKTDGRCSLDEVMRALWQRHGQGDAGSGVGDSEIRQIAEECSGLKLKNFFTQAIDSCDDLPLAKLLKPFGIKLHWETASGAATLGVKTSTEGKEIRLAHVFEGGAAQTAGLSPGDLLLAIDGLRVTPATLNKQLARYRQGSRLRLHAFRRDELMRFDLTLPAPARDQCKLTIAEEKSALRKNWLNE